MESVLEVLDLMANLRHQSALEKITTTISNPGLEEDLKAKLHLYRAICHSETGDYESALKDLDIWEENYGKSSNWLFR